MTETSLAVLTNDSEEKVVYGSCGTLVPGTMAKVIQQPNYFIIKRNLNNIQNNVFSFHNITSNDLRSMNRNSTHLLIKPIATKFQ